MIPRLLSQTWKSVDLEPAAERLRARWRAANPDLDCRLYDDSGARAVVAETFPDHLDAYDAMPFAVMRADIFRYAVLWRDGGLYGDIDMECLKPLPDFVWTLDCAVSVEARLSETRRRELDYAAPFQIANCFMAARPGHPFFKAAAERGFALFEEAGDVARGDVEDITGPRMLTRLFYAGDWTDMSVCAQIVFMAPLHYPDVWPVNRSMHARHRTFGSWKERGRPGSLARRWIERDRIVNPFPARLHESATAFKARHGGQNGA